MSRRVNHRGWIVIDSVPSGDGDYCVDLLEHPEGGFGFEHFRADPEDGGRWSAIGGFGGHRFDSLVLAAVAGRDAIPWLARSQDWADLVTTVTDPAHPGHRTIP